MPLLSFSECYLAVFVSCAPKELLSVLLFSRYSPAFSSTPEGLVLNFLFGIFTQE